MSKESKNLTMEELEEVCEVETDVTEVEESKVKKVWQKIKKPAIIIGSVGAGIIAGLLLAGGRDSDEIVDCDYSDVEESNEE